MQRAIGLLGGGRSERETSSRNRVESWLLRFQLAITWCICHNYNASNIVSRERAQEMKTDTERVCDQCELVEVEKYLLSCSETFH